MFTKTLTTDRLLAAMMPAMLLAAPATFVTTDGWAQQIEEVTVTARRREENIQDIPVSVSAFDNEFIETQGVFSTKDVVKLVPGVQFDQGFSAADTRISIRGINNSRGRASVAMLIDGIDISGENVTAGGGSSLLNTRLLDLERIEVVKGPQSALYGRNAFAGAINYITKKPNMEELNVNVSAEAAEYETYNLRGTVSGPFIPGVLAGSLNVAGFETDGYFNNNELANPVNDFGQPIDPGNEQKLNGARTAGIRGALLWTPTDTLEILAAITLSNEESDPRAVAKVADANRWYDASGSILPDTFPQYSAFSSQTYGQWIGTVKSVDEAMVQLSNTADGGTFKGSEDDRRGGSLKINWDFGAATFRSLTSYLDNEAKLYEDVDYQNVLGTAFPGGPGPQSYLSLANDYQDQTDTKQFTQDFIIESNDWDRGQWLVGVQYFNEEIENSDFSLGWYNDPSLFFAPGLCGTDPLTQVACGADAAQANGDPAKTIDRDTDSYSIYGMLGFDFTDRFTGSLELRYVKDEIKVTTNTAIDRVSQYLLNVPIDLAGIAPEPVPLPQSDKQTTDTVNPRLALNYNFTDDAMIYGSAAKGTKPGGFGTSQMSLPQIAKVDQETLYAYEIGAKTTWLDQTLRLNGAIFYNDYQDRQVGVTVTDPVSGWPSSGIVNAAEAETKGLEIEATWLANEYLTLALGYAYTDAEWTDFNYNEIRPGGASEKDRAICQDPNGDCSGAFVAGIPENALTLVGNWTQPVGNRGWEWFLNANARYQDERAIYDRVETAFVDSNWRVDAQLGMQNEQWQIMLFAKNLLDDDTVLWGQGYQDFSNGMFGGTQGGQPRDESVMAFLPDPRILGVRVNWKYGN